MSSNIQQSPSTSSRRRSRKNEDEKLARNLAAVKALTSPSSSSRSNKSNRFISRSKKRTDASSTRLKFLLSILLATSLLLVILQAFRHLRTQSNSSIQTRLRKVQDAMRKRQQQQQGSEGEMDWKEKMLDSASAFWSNVDNKVQDPKQSGIAMKTERQEIEEKNQNPLSWKSYIGSMKKHFDDELNKVKGGLSNQQQKDGKHGLATNLAGGGGMSIIPGEDVRDHKVTLQDLTDDQDPPAIPGKTDQEAKNDRKIALEDIDQETFKAMYDALYGRGV